MIEGTAFYGIVSVEYISVKGARTVCLIAELSRESEIQKNWEILGRDSNGNKKIEKQLL